MTTTTKSDLEEIADLLRELPTRWNNYVRVNLLWEAATDLLFDAVGHGALAGPKWTELRGLIARYPKHAAESAYRWLCERGYAPDAPDFYKGTRSEHFRAACELLAGAIESAAQELRLQGAVLAPATTKPHKARTLPKEVELAGKAKLLSKAIQHEMVTQEGRSLRAMLGHLHIPWDTYDNSPAFTEARADWASLKAERETARDFREAGANSERNSEREEDYN